MISLPKISVVIPIKNGEQTLVKCLHSITTQTIASQIEIIVLDSQSTDKSVAIANEYKAKIINVPEGTFNHGLTRNLGIANASGDFIFLTVQDAAIAENNMLEKMATHFWDEKVMAVVAHQATPHDADKNPAKWFRRISEPEVETRYFPDGQFATLSKEKQFELSRWDDVCAMYRKTASQALPFRETNFSEDCLWAYDALNAGFKLIRDPSLVVHHYHHMSFNYVLKSKFIINYNDYIYFQHIPDFKLSPMNTMKIIYQLVKKRDLTITKKFYWIFHNIGASLANFISVIIFRISLSIGKEKMLNRAYQIICKSVPQGHQKNSE